MNSDINTSESRAAIKGKFSWKNSLIAVALTLIIAFLGGFVVGIILKVFFGDVLTRELILIANKSFWFVVAIVCTYLAIKLETKKYDSYCCMHPFGEFLCVFLGSWLLMPFVLYGFLQIKAHNLPLKVKNKKGA